MILLAKHKQKTNQSDCLNAINLSLTDVLRARKTKKKAVEHLR